MDNSCCCKYCYQIECLGKPSCSFIFSKLAIAIFMSEGIPHDILRIEWEKLQDQNKLKLPKAIQNKSGDDEKKIKAMTKFLKKLQKNHGIPGEPVENAFNRRFWMAVQNTGILRKSFFEQFSNTEKFQIEAETLNGGKSTKNEIRDLRSHRKRVVQNVLEDLLAKKKRK